MTPEGRVKAAVKKLLKSRGIYYYMPSQTGYGIVGVPDFICCDNGRFIGIETKAPGKRSQTTPNQKVQLALIEQAGGDAMVIDDIKQLEEYFDAREKESSPSQEGD